MRELLFKNNISKDRTKTQLFLSEHLESNGIAQDLEKKTCYRIKEVLQFTDIGDLEAFLDKKRKQSPAPQTFIVRKRNKKTGTAKFFYKVLGEQYIVLGDKVVALRVSRYVKKTVTDRTLAVSGNHA